MFRRNRLSSQSLSSIPGQQKNSSSHSPNSGNSRILLLNIDSEAKDNRNNFKNDNAMNMSASIPAAPRSESMAYASHSSGSAIWSKVTYFVRYNTKAILIGIGMLLVILVMTVDDSNDKNYYLRM
jgi:hypothetical protein